MSTAPRGSILFRYIPGVGKVAAVECGTSPTATCASALSTVDQTLTAGSAVNIGHDTVTLAYGITATTGSNFSFRVPATGVYKIIPSFQYLAEGNGNLTIWIKVNGVNVPNSTTFTLMKNNEEGVVTTEYLLELVAGDQIQIWALAGVATTIVNYVAAGGSGADAYPAAPGIITNIYRIR